MAINLRCLGTSRVGGSFRRVRRAPTPLLLQRNRVQGMLVECRARSRPRCNMMSWLSTKVGSVDVN